MGGNFIFFIGSIIWNEIFFSKNLLKKWGEISFFFGCHIL
jgi:hypothetical protein